MVWVTMGGGVVVLIAIIHSVVGERLILPRLLRCADLPVLRGDVRFTRSILRWAWHLTSVAWVGFALLLFIIASEKNLEPVTLVRIIAAVFGVSGLIAFITTRGRHAVWPLFAAAAAATWFGVQ